MKKQRYFYQDHEISEDEAYDDGILKDGVRMVTSVMMRDSAGNMLTDAFGQPLRQGHRGYVFADADPKRRADDRDYEKAKLSAAWKGGLQPGDYATVRGQPMEVTDVDADKGTVTFADSSEATAEQFDALKRAAYDEGVRQMNDAWKSRPTTLDAEPGDACYTQRGERGQWWRSKDGKMICKPSGSEASSAREYELAGPLSDAVEVQKVRDSAYAESVEALQNAWRK